MKQLEPIGLALFLAIAFGFGVHELGINSSFFSGVANTATVIDATPLTSAQSTNSFSNDLSIGETSPEVLALKKFLNNMYQTNVLAMTSLFDTKTEALLMKYQLDNNLPQTGVLDVATRTLMNTQLKKN